MYVPIKIPYLFRIVAIRLVNNIDNLQDIKTADTKVSVQFFKNTDEPNDAICPSISMLEDSKDVSKELRRGLKKLARAVESDLDTQFAFNTVLEKLFMAARKEGANDIVQKMKKVADSSDY